MLLNLRVAQFSSEVSVNTVTGTPTYHGQFAPGTTRIECAACEPEIIDLCNLLVKMGAKISGIASPELIIEGVEKLHGCEHNVIADRIEAGTFIVAAAITKGDVTVKGIQPNLLGAFLDKLEEAGVPLEVDENQIRVLPTLTTEASRSYYPTLPGRPDRPSGTTLRSDDSSRWHLNYY